MANRIGDTIRANLPVDLLDEYSARPWSQIVGMRVRMAHLYAENDTALMWNTLVNDVQKLRGYIAHTILRQA